MPPRDGVLDGSLVVDGERGAVGPVPPDGGYDLLEPAVRLHAVRPRVGLAPRLDQKTNSAKLPMKASALSLTPLLDNGVPSSLLYAFGNRD